MSDCPIHYLAYNPDCPAPDKDEAEEIFARTSDTYIVGLSLPEDDFLLRCLFVHNLQYRRDPDAMPNTFIINPDHRVQGNFAFALRSKYVKFIEESFSDSHVAFMVERDSRNQEE